MLRTAMVGLIVALSGCSNAGGTLSGEAAFTPRAGEAKRQGVNELTLWVHDSTTMATGCDVPRGDEYKLLLVTLKNTDGGALSPGAYPIKPPGAHAGEYALLLETQSFFVGSGTPTDFGGRGISGVATLKVLSADRTAGEFSTTLTLTSDGGSSELSGSWDVPFCTP